MALTESSGSAPSTSLRALSSASHYITYQCHFSSRSSYRGVASVPTFMDNLLSQGVISTEVLGVSFRPESGSDTDDANGELTLGGTDSTKYTGSITYTPKATSGAVCPCQTCISFQLLIITLGCTLLGSLRVGHYLRRKLDRIRVLHC